MASNLPDAWAIMVSYSSPTAFMHDMRDYSGENHRGNEKHESSAPPEAMRQCPLITYCNAG